MNRIPIFATKYSRPAGTILNLLQEQGGNAYTIIPGEPAENHVPLIMEVPHGDDMADSIITRIQSIAVEWFPDNFHFIIQGVGRQGAFDNSHIETLGHTKLLHFDFDHAQVSVYLQVQHPQDPTPTPNPNHHQ